MAVRNNKLKVAVAMSGGVDSAVTAFLLKKQGFEIIGITLKLVDDNLASVYEKSCCSIESVVDAKKVCAQIAIPHYVLNLKNEFNKFVIQPFIKNYLKGTTPNPCILCNEKIKFNILLNKIKDFGFKYLATGHYASIVYDKNKKQYFLKKAVDKIKDQSYFLYGLTQKELPRVLFPLGNLKKTQVRELAERNNLPVAEKKDSQEICFVPEGDYKKMFKKSFTNLYKEGDIVNTQGTVLGKHKGIVFYTIGQRKGLGIAYSKPLYVVEINYQKNIIIADEEKYLYHKNLIVENLSWVNKIKQKNITAKIKIRSTSELKKGKININGNKAEVNFFNPQRAITPGQAVVFYKHSTVLGGGIIAKVS